MNLYLVEYYETSPRPPRRVPRCWSYFTVARNADAALAAVAVSVQGMPYVGDPDHGTWKVAPQGTPVVHVHAGTYPTLHTPWVRPH